MQTAAIPRTIIFSQTERRINDVAKTKDERDVSIPRWFANAVMVTMFSGLIALLSGGFALYVQMAEMQTTIVEQGKASAAQQDEIRRRLTRLENWRDEIVPQVLSALTK